jgi:hypothetical protein
VNYTKKDEAIKEAYYDSNTLVEEFKEELIKSPATLLERPKTELDIR